MCLKAEALNCRGMVFYFSTTAQKKLDLTAESRSEKKKCYDSSGKGVRVAHKILRHTHVRDGRGCLFKEMAVSIRGPIVKHDACAVFYLCPRSHRVAPPVNRAREVPSQRTHAALWDLLPLTDWARCAALRVEVLHVSEG